MSELVVIGFDDPSKADEVLLTLKRLQKEHLIDLEDAAVVIRNHDGKIQWRHTGDLKAFETLSGGVFGGFRGVFFGMFLAKPLLGWVVGTAVGTGAGLASRKLYDIGIDDEFIEELSVTLAPGTSALFVLVKEAQPEKVLAELKVFEGRVLRSTLLATDEAALRAALEA